MSQTLLAVDVGNSNCKFGQFEIDVAEAGRHEPPDCTWFLSVERHEQIPWQQLADRLSQSGNVSSCLAASNPAWAEELLAQWPTVIARPQQLPSRETFPLTIAVQEPQRVGIDRLLAAVAANRLREPSEPVIIVDAGTATTVNLLTAEAEFVGGAILPGLRMGARALAADTAALPDVSPEIVSVPDPVGRSTVAAIQSGLFWGQVGAIERLVSEFRRRLQSDGVRSPRLLLTGGTSDALRAALPEFAWHPHLCLQGIAVVWANSCGSAEDAAGDG